MKASQYQLLQEMQAKGFNVVTCGNCGTVILHRTPTEQIKCYDCKFKSEPCDFPDLFHQELKTKKKKK